MMHRTFAVEVERVILTVRFPVNEEMKNRASVFFVSTTFKNSMQEYFDSPESLEAMAKTLLHCASCMREVAT